MDEREQFEEWARDEQYDIALHRSGNYYDTLTGIAWDAWSKRAALAPAQPIQEPVAWLCEHNGIVQAEIDPSIFGDHWKKTPLYAAPSPTKDQT